jgi:hypothetical protein
MKKGTVIALSGVILLLLTINMFRQHVKGVKSEREWYIKELGFKFSAVVDTVRESHIRMHRMSGRFDFDKERRVKEKLKYNGRLDLFLYRNERRIELMIDSAYNYKRGDSVFIDCEAGLVSLYRNKQRLAENSLLRSIKGRPF